MGKLKPILTVEGVANNRNYTSQICAVPFRKFIIARLTIFLLLEKLHGPKQINHSP